MKKTTRLQWKVLRYLFTYVIGILFLLWFFQVILLQPFYEFNKINVVKEVADKIEKYIDSNQLEEYVSSLSDQNDLCVRIISENDISTRNAGCRISQLPVDKLLEYANLAIQNNGSYLSKSDLVEMQFVPDTLNTVTAKFNGDKNVIYTKVVNLESDSPTIIMVNTRISRVNAATQALSYQLLFIGIIVTLSAAILAFFMAKKIVKPIAEINEASQNLSKGDYKHMTSQKDYLEVQELNQTLTEAARQVQKADKAKRDLIANVSHDLRTPLTMITGYGEMMMDLPNEKTDENIKVIVNESKRLSIIVNDLLDLSKLAENKITLNLEKFDITACCREVIKTYDQHLKQERIVIEFDTTEDVNIVGDKHRISQVLHNLINNAINYSDENKRIIIHQRIEGEKVKILVQDFGCGIAESDLPLIWDRYYKVDKEHIRSDQGSGIGLAIVREILDLHHYTYGVESKINEGSIFYFETTVEKGE